MKAAGDIPLTVKMRKGIDADHLTYLDAGRAAEGAGVASIALHARTAADYYSGHADWSAIAKLKQAIESVPVLGNGDIWAAEDAIRMTDETGADGVVVGRGCLGRPWLFGDLAAAFHARAAGLDPADTPRAHPSQGQVADTFRRHVELLAEFFESEERGCRDARKHVAWYFKGYPVGGDLRAALASASSLEEIDGLLATLDRDQPYPGAGAEGARPPGQHEAHGAAGPVAREPRHRRAGCDGHRGRGDPQQWRLRACRSGPRTAPPTPSGGTPSSTRPVGATSRATGRACCTPARYAAWPPRRRC